MEDALHAGSHLWRTSTETPSWWQTPQAVAFHIFMESSARGDLHFVPIAKTCTSCSQSHPGEERQMGQPHSQTTRGSHPQDHIGCKCYKTKCSRPPWMWWKMNPSSASLLISTLNSCTGVRSRLRKLQKVAQWVLWSQGRETFGGLLTTCWTIHCLADFSANGNNHRPATLMWLLPRFLESDNFVTQFL